MPLLKYRTRNNIEVTRSTAKVPFRKGLRDLMHSLDRQRGIYLSSGYEYPGRYSRWDIASVCPPLEIVAFGRRVEFRPLNDRGAALNKILLPILQPNAYWEDLRTAEGSLIGQLKPLPQLFSEEERSKQPSIFSVLRTLVQEFRNEQDSRLNLIGAFGYDLLFQFDPIRFRLARGERKDLHLFLCDDIYFMDRKKEQIEHCLYEFATEDATTEGVARTNPAVEISSARPASGEIVSDHAPDEYMANVERVRDGMKQGDYYEVVLRQTFSAPFSGSVSELFERV